MPSPARPHRCAACDEPQRSDRDPLVEEGFHHDVVFHLSCFNSPAAQAWRARAMAADPAYRRFTELTTEELPVTCPGCGEVHAVSPKAVGMAAGSWNPNCTRCHRQSPEALSWVHRAQDVASALFDTIPKLFLGPDDLAALRPELERARPAMEQHSKLIEALEGLRGDYLRGRNLEAIPRRMAELAARHDPPGEAGDCPCGGRYSLSAPSRCPGCGEVLLDSLFHDVCPP